MLEAAGRERRMVWRWGMMGLKALPQGGLLLLLAPGVNWRITVTGQLSLLAASGSSWLTRLHQKWH